MGKYTHANADSIAPTRLSITPRKLYSLRRLHRNGRSIVQVALLPHLVVAFAAIATAFLRRGKARSNTSQPYFYRAIKGMAGEIAFHFFAKRVLPDARIMLPTDYHSPVDHRIVHCDVGYRVQSKTMSGEAFNLLHPDCRLLLNSAHDDASTDLYSFAFVDKETLWDLTGYCEVSLFAIVPIASVREHARTKSGKRFIRVAQIPEDAVHRILDPTNNALPYEASLSDTAFKRISSTALDDWLPEALQMIGSSIDAERIFDLVANDPTLRKL